jgi:S1-C subfamily serine protease
MGRANRLLLVAVLFAGLLTLALAGLVVARWRAPVDVPALDTRVVLTVTPIPTVPPLTPAPTAPALTPVASGPADPGGRATMVNRALQGVVQVRVPDGLGTGFVWARESDRTLVVTAAHVVAGWERVEVIAPDGTAHPATVRQRDERHDVALLEAPALVGVQPLPRGQSRQLPLGSALTALGYALGDQLLGEPTVTRGVLSGRRTFDGIEFLQTDAALNPGVSGGPLLDEQGRVVGMAIGGIPWAGEIPAQGVNFAVAIEEIEQVVATA